MLKILSLALTTLAALYLGFGGLAQPLVQQLYQGYAYYFVLAAVILWLQLLCQAMPEKSRIISFLKFHLGATALAALLTGLMFAASPPDFRILADETNLLGISKAMYENHSAHNPTQQAAYYHGFQKKISQTTDIRPLLFPFCTSLLHSTLGYSPAHPFAINALAALGCLWLTYYLAYLVWGRLWGFAAMLAFASYPLFVLYATSAGFEVFNLLLALLTLNFFWLFLKSKTALAAELLLYTALLLAQTRYESAIGVLLIAPAIIYYLKKPQRQALTLRTLIYPLLFLPAAWVRLLNFTGPSFQVETLHQAFSFSHILLNIKMFFIFILGKSTDYGMNTAIAALALVGLAILGWRLARGRMFKDCLYPREARVFLWFAALFFASHALVRFAFYWGNLTLQYTSRLGIIFLPALVFLALYTLKSIMDGLSLHKSWAIILPVACIFYGWPAAGQNLGVRDIVLYREFKSARAYLEAHHAQKADYILVTPLSNLYVPLNYNVINFNYFNANHEQVLKDLRHKTWTHLIFMQRISISNQAPEAESQIQRPLVLETLHQTQISADSFLQISKFKPAH